MMRTNITAVEKVQDSGDAASDIEGDIMDWAADR
jgi:hypothetical protein